VSFPTVLPKVWMNVLFNDAVSCRDFITLVMVERVQSIDRMMLTRRNRCIRRRTCPSSTLSTISGIA